VRCVLGIAAIAVFQILSSSLCGLSADALRGHVSVGQTAGPILEPATTLQSQLEPILKAAAEGDAKQLDNLIDGLRIPDGADWFTRTFGKEIGDKLAATYSASWNDYRSSAESMFRDRGASKQTHVFVKRFSTSSIARRDTSIQSILRSAIGPLVLYTARAGENRGDDALPGVYVFAQGHFRVVNWKTFFDLPNFKPVRIRVDRQITPEPAGRKDSPTPSDSQHPQVQGTVWIHVIIDRDGIVAQAESASGPAEFVSNALQSARQWRFEPKILKGDPVEVDTTIALIFVKAPVKLE
jgi:TonB family protein